MKVLKQLFLMMFMVAGLSLAVSAQKDPPKGGDRPPKQPPVIKPGDKPPRDTNRPPRDPKKPEMSWFVSRETEESSFAD
jgi:hypothetical protein